MIRSIYHKIFPPPRTDIESLIDQARSFPRYTEHQFCFREMTLNVTDFISVANQLKEYFIDGRMNFESEIVSPVIYDCGANVGVSVMFYKKLFPLAIIKAFEPDPKVFKCLQQNMQQNKISDITLIDKAVWINNDGVEFGSEGADGGSVFFAGNKVFLPTVRLRDMLVSETRIDLLKMDIEGAEVEVLNDCKDQLNKIKYLFVEYHSWKNQPQQLDQLLSNMTEQGFRYYIHSIAEENKKPFIQKMTKNPMDIQLDIHAINDRI